MPLFVSWRPGNTALKSNIPLSARPVSRPAGPGPFRRPGRALSDAICSGLLLPENRNPLHYRVHGQVVHSAYSTRAVCPPNPAELLAEIQPSFALPPALATGGHWLNSAGLGKYRQEPHRADALLLKGVYPSLVFRRAKSRARHGIAPSRRASPSRSGESPKPPRTLKAGTHGGRNKRQRLGCGRPPTTVLQNQSVREEACKSWVCQCVGRPNLGRIQPPRLRDFYRI